tara:strand:+ start:78 stop:329 length:252 start_codon:yes stop_codon:yes gene_type:complete
LFPLEDKLDKDEDNKVPITVHHLDNEERRKILDNPNTNTVGFYHGGKIKRNRNNRKNIEIQKIQKIQKKKMVQNIKKIKKLKN